jgi:flagellar biogenesis protein FliO
MNRRKDMGEERETSHSAGLAQWLMKPLLKRLRGAGRPEPRLELLERIALAPHQSLALVEAEGRRFLVATSAEGGPAFYALDGGARTTLHRAPRVSW